MSAEVPMLLPKSNAETDENGSGDEALEVPENRLGLGESASGDEGLLPCGPVMWIVGTFGDKKPSTVDIWSALPVYDNSSLKLVSKWRAGGPGLAFDESSDCSPAVTAASLASSIRTRSASAACSALLLM